VGVVIVANRNPLSEGNLRCTARAPLSLDDGDHLVVVPASLA
jgi:hypothetical protein